MLTSSKFKIPKQGPDEARAMATDLHELYKHHQDLYDRISEKPLDATIVDFDSIYTEETCDLRILAFLEELHPILNEMIEDYENAQNQQEARLIVIWEKGICTSPDDKKTHKGFNETENHVLGLESELTKLKIDRARLLSAQKMIQNHQKRMRTFFETHIGSQDFVMFG